ncbi:zinc finger protein 16-like [Mya arenaria]|uniref:zinc finger protein 16-like n=1 Tax=Mya arenaria TaxID=6604 RepID=UPI0022E67A21|nr:zinc finger protein 16-like [Mya arenaria]
MEELRSYIMMSAAYRKLQKAVDIPLDLSRGKLLAHTCDSLVNQEDLRTETFDSSSMSTFDRRYVPLSGPVLASEYSVSGSSEDVFSTSDDSFNIMRDEDMQSPIPSAPPVHPFSIAALLTGTTSPSTGSTSAPAVITSAQFPAPGNVYHVQQLTRLPHTYQVFSDGDVDPFWCHACNSLCEDARDARNHQHVHRIQGTSLGLRKSLFLQHGYVTRHSRMDNERFRCSLCEKVVAQCFFAKHQRLHDGHFCEVCHKEFSTSSRLRDHMNVHSGITPFTCSICSRKFSKRSSLTQHYRYHRDHHSFKCSYCSKYFNSKYACSVHERLHTGENPFRCTVPGCDKTYPQKIQLKLHLCSHRM